MSRLSSWFALLLPLSALAQPFAPDTSPPSPEMPPAQVLAQFHHDEINLLALRGDAHSLLVAALMAQADAGDPARPKVLQTPALLTRAQKAADADALVWWASAALECRGKAKICPNEQTLAQLEKADPGNAAAWLLALARAQQAGDTATARAALTSAAQAQRFDDNFGTLVALLYKAAGILPVDERILRASDQPGVNPSGFKLTYVAGIAVALPHPYLNALTLACKDTSTDPSLAADCVAVAQKMADGGSLFARDFGLRLLLQLVPDGAEHDANLARARTAAWRMQHIGELGARLADDSRVTGIYTQTLAASGRESDAVDAVLHSQGVPLDPPAAWQPPPAEAAAQP